MKQRIFVQPYLRRSVPDKVKELATYHLYLHKNFRFIVLLDPNASDLGMDL
jgi:hypothetical protein